MDDTLAYHEHLIDLAVLQQESLADTLRLAREMFRRQNPPPPPPRRYPTPEELEMSVYMPAAYGNRLMRLAFQRGYARARRQAARENATRELVQIEKRFHRRRDPLSQQGHDVRYARWMREQAIDYARSLTRRYATG